MNTELKHIHFSINFSLVPSHNLSLSLSVLISINLIFFLFKTTLNTHGPNVFLKRSRPKQRRLKQEILLKSDWPNIVSYLVARKYHLSDQIPISHY